MISGMFEKMLNLEKALNLEKTIRDIQKAGGSIIYKPNAVGFVDVIRGVYYEVTIYQNNPRNAGYFFVQKQRNYLIKG